MKGLIFTEFLEMVEDVFGFAMVQDLIDQTRPESDGIYTSVGTYAHQEMVAYLIRLSQLSGTPVPDLMRTFGHHLFGRLATLHPHLMARHTNALDFLEGIEEYIHVEVRKLYPEAELPRFDISRNNAGKLTMIYRSGRAMAPLALGLIEGCAAYFKEPVTVEARSLDALHTAVLFTVQRQ